MPHPTLRERLRPPVVGMIWAVFVAGAIAVTEYWAIPLVLGSLILLVASHGTSEPQTRLYRWSSGASAAILLGLLPLYMFAQGERTWMAVVALLSGVPAIVAIVIETRVERKPHPG